MLRAATVHGLSFFILTCVSVSTLHPSVDLKVWVGCCLFRPNVWLFLTRRPSCQHYLSVQGQRYWHRKGERLLKIGFTVFEIQGFRPPNCCHAKPNIMTRPRVSRSALIGACFHDADQTSPAARPTLSMRGCPLLLCTSLFGTLAALRTHTALPDTHFLAAVCHIFFLERTHAWWDHTPGPGAGLYYVWAGLSSRCLVSVFCQRSGETPGFYQRLAVVCQRCGAGGTGKLRCAAEAWFTCAVGSQAGAPALSLDLLQTSFPRRSAVPTAKQNREERNV